MNYEPSQMLRLPQAEIDPTLERMSESHYLKPNQTVVTLWPVPDGTALERLQQLHIDRRVVLTHQVHGSNVLIVNRHSNFQTENVDGLVTTDDTVLAAYGSDCPTITMSDGIVSGIAHAGRAGILAGIIPNLALCMRGVGANESNTRIHIGPGIRSCCYAVDPESEPNRQIERFMEQYVTGVVISRKTGVFLDLQTAIHQSFLQEGFQSTQISFDSRCTCCDQLKFPSHRRQGTRRTGQIVTTIERTKIRESAALNQMTSLIDDLRSPFVPLNEIE